MLNCSMCLNIESEHACDLAGRVWIPKIYVWILILFVGFGFSLTCLAWKRLTETIRRRHIGKQRGTKSASCPSDKNGCQPRALFLHRFTWDFLCSCFRRDVHNFCLWFASGSKGLFSPSEPTRRHPVLPGPASPPPRRARSPTPTH